MPVFICVEEFDVILSNSHDSPGLVSKLRSRGISLISPRLCSPVDLLITTPMNRPSGIVYYNSVSSYEPCPRVCLPLEEVKVKVLIVDVSARVTLTQVYHNSSDSSTGRCKYCFPVPENAAICAFGMTTSDGHALRGIAKEKDQAREEYQDALNSRKFAGILDYVTGDIFTISIGAIPAQTKVEINLVYVMSLANDDNVDEVRFQLPMSVGERYGTPPPELELARSHSAHTRIRLTAEIQTSGRIQRITSPSHQADISEVVYLTHHGRPSHRRSTIKFKSYSFLERDFILIIQAEALDTPRCFAEIKHDLDGRGSATIAMQLTMVPKFDLPPIREQEYFFVVDRSGSMDGDRISTARRTLAILLRMLPSQRTMFNIFSFGNRVDPLWPRSRRYDQSSLDVATAFVDSIEANYGGTEIRQALQYVLNSATSTMPVAVFVLTDGAAHDMAGTFSVVDRAVKNALPQSPLRVFTLGIGDSVSSAMCEGIARAGRGACLLAVNTESIVEKCVKLLTAGRTPFVQNVRVDWGIDDEHLSSVTSSVNFSVPSSSSRTVKIRSLPVIQQVPTKIQDIHAGTRTNFFVILKLKKITVPESITLRGELDDGSGTFELNIPIHMIRLVGAKDGLPLIHTLAARRLIQEHEEERAPLPQPVSAAPDDQIRKAVIVHLGEKYQLASQYTSFVATDSDQDSRRHHNRASSFHRQDASRARDASDFPAENNLKNGLGPTILNFFAGFFPQEMHGNRSQSIPGAWTDSPMSSPPASDNGADDDGYESAETFSTLSSLDGSAEWSDWSPPPSPEPQTSEEDAQRQRSPSPKFELAPEGERVRGNALPVRLPPPVRAEVVELVRFQLYDGSFPLHSLRAIVGASAVDRANSLQVDDAVWATVLSVAFIEKHMGGQKELMENLLIKALEYLRSRHDIDMKELIKIAKDLVL